jgi:transposase-like protein
VLVELREIRKEIVASREPSSNPFSCPRCGSDNVQRISLIYEQGSSNIQTNSTHVASFGAFNQPVVGSTVTHGSQQTHLAIKYAPPVMRDENTPPVVGVIVGVVVLIVGLAVAYNNDGMDAAFAALGAISGPIVCVAVGICSGRDNARWNRTAGANLLDSWKRKCLCWRCGTEFEHADVLAGAKEEETAPTKAPEPDYKCAVCSRRFPVTAVYDEDGKYICKKCFVKTATTRHKAGSAK